MSDINLNGASKKIILNGTTYFASGGGGSTPTLITKTITENDTYSAEDDSADGYSEVEVDVEPNVGTKTITENGTYNASSDSLQGYSQVVVNVQSKVVNPVYNWFANEDETLVVREKISDGSYRWYFNNFNITSRSGSFMPVPSNLQRFATGEKGARCTVTDGTVEEGVVGFYSGTIRLWNGGLSYNQLGKAKGILESTDTNISYNNYHAWEEPSFDPING